MKDEIQELRKNDLKRLKKERHEEKLILIRD